MTLKNLAAVVVLVSLFAPASAQVKPPDTPAGRILTAWLDAVNSGDRTRIEKFEADHDGRMPHNVQSLLRLREQSGGFDVQSIRKSTPLYLEYTLKERAGSREAIGMLEVSAANSTRVANTMVRLMPPDGKVLGFEIDAVTRERVIANIIAKLDEFYVFPDVAKKMGAALRAREKGGDYSQVSNGVAFESLLTQQLREVSHDKHLRVSFSPIALPQGMSGPGPRPRPGPGQGPGAGPGPGPGPAPSRGDCGFEKAEKLAGNVGYIKLNGFADPGFCQGAATAAITALEGADAVIFDLRDNGGGAPQMVAFLTSYLFGERTHLNDLWTRRTGETAEFWTNPDVPGPKFTTQPVYVLTSSRTFSGAEEFSYNLKALKRATIVGETTGGGAHPVRGETLDERFLIFVPDARAINPITKTNWEGVGVEPDVKVPAAEALATASKLAAEKLRAATPAGT
jgi:hypothetical protein